MRGNQIPMEEQDSTDRLDDLEDAAWHMGNLLRLAHRRRRDWEWPYDAQELEEVARRIAQRTERTAASLEQSEEISRGVAQA